ncbi:MAG: hypothetical protein ACRD9R_17360 [Pyrinomonadaceae bacterium]
MGTNIAKDYLVFQRLRKSYFYLARFDRAHVRVNLDMLRTRHREQLL